MKNSKGMKKIMPVFLTILLLASIPLIASALDNPPADTTPPDITDLGSHTVKDKYCKAIKINDSKSGVQIVWIIEVDNANVMISNPKPRTIYWEGNKVTYKYGKPYPKEVNVDVCYKDKDKTITIKVQARNGWGKDSPEKTFTNPAIPEFTTIAIPVAAILGLVFLFSRRKRK